MPGVHACIRAVDSLNGSCTEGLLNSLRRTETDRLVLDEGGRHGCVFSRQYYYPMAFSKRDDGFVCLDGLVYNEEEPKVLSRLKEIWDALGDDARSRALIADFVRDMDGDFIAVLRKAGKWVVFNDMFARLAFYYYCDGTTCAISREPKGILGAVEGVSLDRVGLVEYVSLRYPLGKRTLFKSISRMRPSELLEIDASAGKIRLNARKTAKVSFDLEEAYPDRESAQADLAETLTKSIAARVATANKCGAAIAADLSGGFDTRAVMALLAGVTPDVAYVSIKLSTGDESGIARSLYEAMGSPGTFHALDVNHDYILDDTDDLVLENDGLVNYNTTLVCDYDVRTLRKYLGEGRYFRFSGLGGEFIRHPTKIFNKSIFYGYRRGLYFDVVDRFCGFSRIKVAKYFAACRRYLTSYPEKTKDGQLRRWYYEYYNNFVGTAAEDRERGVIWTVQPLWQKDFLNKIFTKVPLEWTGYEFFCGVLGRIDKRALHVPIYGRDIDLESTESLVSYDEKRNEAESKVEKQQSWIIAKYKIKGMRIRKRDRRVLSSSLQKSLVGIIDASNVSAKLFDKKALLEYMAAYPKKQVYEQAVTIIKYIEGLESKLGIKITY